MPDGSEFHTVGAATLKPREANAVRTRGTDNRLVFPEHRERVEDSYKSVREVQVDRERTGDKKQILAKD